MAALIDAGDDSAWVRCDFALDAWNAGERPSGVLIAAWRATMAAGAAVHPRRLDDAEVLELFEQLEDARERPRLIFRYVLALHLCRRRLMRYEGATTTPEGPAILVRPIKPQESPPQSVRDPGLDEAAIADAADELEAMLDGTDRAAAP